MKKHDYPIVPAPQNFLNIAYGYSTNLLDVFEEIPRKTKINY